MAWPRAAARTGALIAVAAVGLLVGCGDNDTYNNNNTDMGGGEDMAGNAGDMAGNAGDMAQFVPGEPKNGKVLGTVQRPTAAALDKDGQTVYVLGYDANQQAQLYTIPAGGGAPVVVPTSIPLVNPVGLAIDSNNNLYIADDGTDDGGAVYRGTTGGALTSMNAGLIAPNGIAVSADGNDIFVTGHKAGAPGLFKIPSGGGAAVVAAQGAPFSNPSGVTLGGDGAIYVVDTTAIGPHEGAILKITGSSAAIFSKTPLSVGFPAGLAPSGTSDLLVTGNATGAAGLFTVKNDGTVSARSLTGTNLSVDGDPSTVARAARANVWVALDTAASPQAAAGTVTGSILLLTP